MVNWKVIYHDEQGEELSELFDLHNNNQRKLFNDLFGRRFANSSEPKQFNSVDEVLALSQRFSAPDFVVARKSGQFWRVQERIFDYQGNYRKANQL